jgi:phosphoribosylanthranilate isomerase
MLTQIYTISSPDEARAIAALGVDHVGSLVGPGARPRELPLDAAQRIGAVVPPPAKFSALFMTDDIALITAWAKELRPAILHVGADVEAITPGDLGRIRDKLPGVVVMRSIPVFGEESLVIARSYDGIADLLLLDSYRPSDRKFGALGLTHDWGISRRIVEATRSPVILAGGLGPDNVAEAIRTVRPAGVDSKTKTDRQGTHSKDLDLVRRFVEAARTAL